MPYYEYECQGCHQHFEIFQKISENPKRKCAACSGKLKKLISPTAFTLKGGGWYKDGYASKKNDAKTSPPPSTDTATGKQEKKTESKKDTNA